MAKSSYKIPYGLNASYADMEIAVRTDDGLGFKPLPLKIILVYLAGIVGCIWMIMRSYVRYGTIPEKILFAVVWAMFLLLLCKYDDTQRMQFSLVPTLFYYLPRSARVIMTRRSSSVNGFYAVAGIKNVTDRGLISWADGTYGFMYRVIGSASILLFKDDQKAILDRVEAYYKKVSPEYEHIWITVKSSQAVYKQVAALTDLYKDLEETDEDLKNLLEEQFDTLKSYVGGSFRSIHQYLVLKADNQEVLNQAKAVLESEINNSDRMIKRCVPLHRQDIEGVMRDIYTGGGAVG